MIRDIVLEAGLCKGLGARVCFPVALPVPLSFSFSREPIFASSKLSLGIGSTALVRLESWKMLCAVVVLKSVPLIQKLDFPFIIGYNRNSTELLDAQPQFSINIIRLPWLSIPMHTQKCLVQAFVSDEQC